MTGKSDYSPETHNISDEASMWQYSWYGYEYDGVGLDMLDVNVSYKDYPAIMKAYGYNNIPQEIKIPDSYGATQDEDGNYTFENAYGFAFYLFGRDVDGGDMVMKSTGDVVSGCSHKGSAWNSVWIYKNDSQICGRLYWKIFLGWKIDYHSPKKKRAMLANRIAIRFK